jgi:hypothetical protein
MGGIKKVATQVEIQFDNVDSALVASILKDIEKASKLPLKVGKHCKSSFVALFYEEVKMDTFHTIMERFQIKPDYSAIMERWEGTTFINASTIVFLKVESEKCGIDYSYNKRKKIA